MANRRFIDFPIAASVGDNDIVLIWQDGLNKQTTKATLLQGSPQSLAGLTDVDIAGLINGQILQYNSTTSKWENVDRTDINLSELGDVTIVAPANGQVLVYNSSTSKWENSSAGYVPYTGAVTTVNLGAQTIQAGSFVKAGGTSAQFLKADGSVDSSTYGTGTVTSVALTMPTAFSVGGSPITTAGTLAVTATGTTSQYIRGDGTLETFPALTGFVPYTGATADVNLGAFDLLAERGTFANNGSSDTLTVNHTSGSGYGIIVTKGGNNEALYVSKTSGSGNAMTVVGGRTSLVDLALSSVTNTAGDFLTLSGGVVHKRTAAEVRTDIGAGTVTSVGLSSATGGVTIGSTPITTSGTITLAIATASGSQNGLLSSTDWSTFNNKQNALTNPVTGTGTTNYLPKFTGASTIGNSIVFDNGTNVGIGTASPEGKLTVEGTSAQPPTSGTTANSLLQLKGSLGNELNIGSNTVAGNYGAYIQASDNNLAVPYQLNLQPNGGNVIIGGYTDAGFKLDVNGTGRFISSGGYFSIDSNGQVTSTQSLDVATAGGRFTGMSSRGALGAIHIEQTTTGANGGYIGFRTSDSGSTTPTEKLRITSSGNVGIGRTPNSWDSSFKALQVGTASISQNNTTTVYIGSNWASESGGDKYITTAPAAIYAQNSGSHIWYSAVSGTAGSNMTFTERMRINASGFLKASNNSVYESATGGYHELNQSNASATLLIATHRASDPYGIELQFSGADPNNASNYVFGAYTTSGGFTWIYRIFSNGTVSARSDARWKKNIETTRSGYIDDLCKLRVVKYNWYNHEDDAPKELGLIAQEVEEIFPNLIQHDPVICKKQVEQKDGTFVEEEFIDGTSRSIKVSVLPYMLLKAIQEQQKQIEELKSKLS